MYKTQQMSISKHKTEIKAQINR